MSPSGISYYALDLNPVPWAIGPLGIGRRKGTGKMFPNVAPNRGLVTYQEAVRAEIEENYADVYVREPFYSLKFGFSRQLEVYKYDEKDQTRNWADVTNMQKATEDALQGLLIDNDRAVAHVESFLIGSQSTDAEPMVVIELMWGMSISTLSQLNTGMMDAILNMRARRKMQADRGPELWVPE